MKSKIPLAWLQLTREKTRLLVALGGIAFADILMFMQLGFKEALFDGNVRLHKNLEGDKASRKEFGPIADEFNHKNNVTVEVGGRRIRVGGIFELGASFGADGNVITSDQNFLRLFRKNRNLGLIDIGLISLKPGANTKVVIEKLRKILPEDVKLMTKQEYIELESYWQNSTSIGFIFNLGTIIGFIVGTVIVYQILYNEVSDHLPEYATLQAMGYTHTYLLSVVFQEALILAVLGYIPGFAFAIFQYTMAKNATLLPIVITGNRALLVLFFTILMCFISGAIAVRKLQAADPADIF